MFIKNDTIEEREQMIYDLLNSEPFLAFSIAFTHFEWSLKRTILSLSKTPSVIVKKKLEESLTINSYRTLWFKEIKEKLGLRVLAKQFADWNDIVESFKMRDRLFENSKSINNNKLKNLTKSLINAARELHTLCLQFDINIYRKVQIRQNRFLKVI
jgi:hypothetical protein